MGWWSAIEPVLEAAVPAVVDYFSQRSANKSALALQENNNAFNEKQYEDWKYYNSIEQQVKRANAAGLNPLSVVTHDTLPSAMQRDNSVSEEKPINALSKAFGKGFANYINLRDKQLQKKQIEFDMDYKDKVLKFQKAQLDSLNTYRTSVLQNQSSKLSLQSQKLLDDKNYRDALLGFKREFYTNPDYLGYWSVKNSKSKYNFDFHMNPVLIDIAKNKRLQGQIFNKHFDDYLNAQISGMAARARYDTYRADKADTLFDLDMAYNQAYLGAAANAQSFGQTTFGKYWNFGNKMLSDLESHASNFLNIFRFGRNNRSSQPSMSIPYNSYHYSSY